MPGSTVLFQSDQDEEDRKKSELATNRQPPPVAPRRATVTLQSWQSITPGSESYGDNKHARSSSMDSLESSGSSSSSGGYGISNNRCNESQIGEYIPTRLPTKAPKLPLHNPLQFVKVQSPLYKKAEQQIKLTKEEKICREAVKEGEEEWQSNLDNWKSRRRKVTEKVIQRAEEMRQIEADEQLKHEQNLMHQRKIKKFSQIVEGRSARSYSLDLYIGQGDDSGLGGTPEPDDVIDSQCSILRSDTSEGMTSEAESIDSDSHRSDRLSEPPVVPKKPHSWLKRNAFIHCNNPLSPTQSYLSNVSVKDVHCYDNNSSTEQSDAEGHVCDSEAISSEEDIYFVDAHKIELENEKSDDHNLLHNDEYFPENYISEAIENEKSSSKSQSADACNEKKAYNPQTKVCNQTYSFKLCIKPGDNKGFGFSIKGGKDLSCTPCIDSVVQDGPAYLIGLRNGDEIVSMNGEFACAYSHASLLLTIKQAVYTGVLDIEISRVASNDSIMEKIQSKPANKSSFAEKLAKFSSGVNSDSCTSSFTSGKTDAKESLVLRRRSAFENGKSEKMASFSLGETPDTNRDDIKKRFSADFSCHYHQKSGVNKKDPPPPVPVKPKLRPKQLLKSKTIDDSECDSFSRTDNLDAIDNFQPSLEPANSEQCTNINQITTTEHSEQSEAKAYDLPISVNNSCFSELSLSNDNVRVLNITSQPHKIVHQLSLNAEEDAVTNIQNSNIDLEDLSKRVSLDIETFENKIALVNETVAENKLSPTYTTAIEVSFKNVNNVNTDDSMEFIPLPFAQDASSSVNEIMNYETEKLDDVYSSACNIACKDIENMNLSNTILESLTLESIEESVNEAMPSDFEHIPDDDDADNLVAEVNPSPLCLSLEKADDDDGVSASTTTSSDSPDTETVIETLPSNLSPLPNDESNGEETINHLNNYEEEETSRNESVGEAVNLNCAAVNDGNAVNLSSCTEFQRIIIDQPGHRANLGDFILPSEDIIDEQDEEYNRELDESLDQITSLDVIDEIEQRLMQQLQHQDDNFEDIDNDMELENDVNQDWIYYSEADFLDLTPSNREPPKEPPPPPPVDPEPEEALSLTRTNSTKRIKKEMWRRRSDFLGLDSTHCSIDVDNIIHPPPGLEEILKLEHEQTQWLEKRLSIVEAENIADTSLSTQTTFRDSQNLVQSEYSSSYLLDDEEISKLDFDPKSEIWQENLEENVFEPDFESFSSPASCPTLEKNSKVKESPQHKAKQNIQNLGAAPKAKIMDSNKWITERVTSLNKQATEPLFRQASYDQNYWIAQDANNKRSVQADVPNRRYSMTSQLNTHTDVTLRTWDDRESEIQKQRPLSAQWDSPNRRNSYDSDSYLKQSILRTQSFDDNEDIECSSDILESEVHKCSCCGKGLCEGSAMGIEALRLYFHIECFRCCMCQMLLGNGMCGTDVQVKNNQLYCPNCFTVD